MFKEARIKLTAWYSVIIMIVSLSFSGIIYVGINMELVRIDNVQKEREARLDDLRKFLIQNSLPFPQETQSFEIETVEHARLRVVYALGLINVSILVISGIGGYFLAGLTLDPISKMVKEQKEFVSNASHELRTPLTSLKTEIEVALRDKKLSLMRAKNILKSNLDDINSMQKLSNYLLKLHRFENSEVDMKMEKIDLGKVTLKVIKSKGSYAKQNKIKIVKNITKVYVNGNEEYITELASILIENAIKYSGKAKKIEVSTKKGGFLVVRDFGIGIAKNDLPHVFDRFYRADSSRSKENAEGFGLGLSIAKSITEKLGAKIRVQSKMENGSTFSVQFASNFGTV